MMETDDASTDSAATGDNDYDLDGDNLLNDSDILISFNDSRCGYMDKVRGWGWGGETDGG